MYKRQDLSYVNISGRTRVGYNIDALIEVLESFLGFTNMHKAFLFGVGSLGAALLRDSGLHHFGLEIVAAFDVNPELVGKDLNGIPIFHSDDFEAKMKEYDVNIGAVSYTHLDVYKRQIFIFRCWIIRTIFWNLK